MSRIIAGFENTAVKETTPSQPLSRHSPPLAPHAAGAKPSFAEVLRKPPRAMALVQTEASGDRVLIHLPKSPKPMRANTRKDDARVSPDSAPKRRPDTDPGALIATIKEQVVKEVRAELNEMVLELFTTFRNEMRTMMTELVTTMKDVALGIPAPINQQRQNLEAQKVSETEPGARRESEKRRTSIAGNKSITERQNDDRRADLCKDH